MCVPVFHQMCLSFSYQNVKKETNVGFPFGKISNGAVWMLFASSSLLLLVESCMTVPKFSVLLKTTLETLASRWLLCSLSFAEFPSQCF